ncbi:hypothetical protein A9X00_07665 [Mycobacterium sp. 1245805.9]|nr:hypothetical protein A9X00_07665 [Mycobacterium sp. 1245805.9]
MHENWQLVAVLDMGWEEYQVAAEYDGDQHRADRRQYVRDQARLRKLADLGRIVVRVIAEDRRSPVAGTAKLKPPLRFSCRVRGLSVAER